jgi:hypothetical protein
MLAHLGLACRAYCNPDKGLSLFLSTPRDCLFYNQWLIRKQLYVLPVLSMLSKGVLPLGQCLSRFDLLQCLEEHLVFNVDLVDLTLACVEIQSAR